MVSLLIDKRRTIATNSGILCEDVEETCDLMTWHVHWW